jgi:hypothetical protein
LSTKGKHFKKAILETIQKHTEERNLLNASQFGFRALHSVTLQSMRLMDHATLNFNNNLSITAEFLDVEDAFDTAWYSGLLYKLSELQFLTSVIKVLVQGKFFTSRELAA